MCLVCKKCGYKQYDEECINAYKKASPEQETHDITYYCGACLDNASDDEYKSMIAEIMQGNCS